MKALEKAKLGGVTPHPLRHTMGSTSTSTGEALALTGAILCHSNPRSTAIYAHVQTDPSRRPANRVTKKIAAALAGKPANDRQRKRGGPVVSAGGRRRTAASARSATRRSAYRSSSRGRTRPPADAARDRCPRSPRNPAAAGTGGHGGKTLGRGGIRLSNRSRRRECLGRLSATGAAPLRPFRHGR